MADNWRAITRDEAAKIVGVSELEAYETVELAEGETQPLEKLIADVTEQFRDAIRSQPTNQVGADGTLPGGAIPEALAIIRFRLHTRIGASVSEERMEEYRQARTYMGGIASGRYKFTVPDELTEETAQSSSPSPSYVKRTRGNTIGI